MAAYTDVFSGGLGRHAFPSMPMSVCTRWEGEPGYVCTSSMYTDSPVRWMLVTIILNLIARIWIIVITHLMYALMRGAEACTLYMYQQPI